MIKAASVFGFLGIGLLVGLLVYHGVGPIWGMLELAGWGLVWASLFHMIPMAVNAYAWRVLFAVGGKPSWARMILAVWIRESVNGLLPVARIGGEVVSYRILKSMGFGATPVVASLISDMTLALVSQFLFTVLGLVVLLIQIDSADVMWRVIGGLAVFLPMVGGLFAIQRYGIINLGEKITGALFGDKWAELVGNAALLDDMLRLVYRRPGRVIISVGGQLLGWILGTGEIWLAMKYLGHPLPFSDAFVMESLAQAVSSAAFIVPGALGVQEGGFMLFASLLGLPPSLGLALAFARRFRDIVIFVPGLLVWQSIETKRFIGWLTKT